MFSGTNERKILIEGENARGTFNLNEESMHLEVNSNEVQNIKFEKPHPQEYFSRQYINFLGNKHSVTQDSICSLKNLGRVFDKL